MFNNSQLCSQAPSPQREPHHAAWTAAGSLLCVCSVTLISSMSMFPILTGYNAGTYAVVLIIQHGIVQEGVYSVSPAPAFFLQFVTQFTQTCSVERFRACVWRMHRRTGTTCTYCGRKNEPPTREVKEPVFTGFRWKAVCPYCNVSTAHTHTSTVMYGHT